MKTKIKHLALLLTLVAVVVSAANICFATDQKIDVYENDTLVKSVVFPIGSDEYYVNGQVPGIKMDAVTFIENDRTFVPVRYLGYALGVKDRDIIWDGERQQATLIKDDTVLMMVVGRKEIRINLAAKDIDVAPVLKSVPAWRTYLPARYVAEGLGYEVGWDADNQLVICWPKGQPKPDITTVVEYVKEQKQEQVSPKPPEPVKPPKQEPVKPGVFVGETYEMNGYVLPVDTDLSIPKTDPSRPHKCELEIMIFVAKPLSKQYNDIEAIISQKFDSQIVSEAMEHIKQKTDWKQEIVGKRWVCNGKTMEVISPGGSDVVNILVWDKICPFE